MKTKLIKITMCSLLFASSLVTLAAVAMTSATARADSDGSSCGVYTLHASYLFATHGWNIISGVAQPKAIVEGIDFNGDGTLVSPFATVSINGTIVRTTGTVGTYTVNPDCTGTITFSTGQTYDIFVQPTAKQLWMIQTGPDAVPAVFEGTATRVSR
jgi:hypothetical protein